MLIPQELQLSPQLIWLSLKTWLLYWSESYKHLHCSGKFHPKKGFLQCFQIKEVVMRMFELVPVPVITDFLLVLFTKSLSFYAITFRKHTDAHRSRFNLLLLKKKRTQN